MTSQTFDAFVPVYDTIPETWEESRPFLVETLRSITESLNVKEIGFYLEEELLSGAQFIPTEPQQFRAVFRKVIDMGAVAVGANSFPHGINFTADFTLLKLYVSGTNSTTLEASTITDGAYMDATNINVTSPRAYDKTFAVAEYILEQ